MRDAGATFAVTWTGVATWAGPVGNIESAVQALAVVIGLGDLGMRNIVVREYRADGTRRKVTVAELEHLAEQEDRGEVFRLRAKSLPARSG